MDTYAPVDTRTAEERKADALAGVKKLDALQEDIHRMIVALDDLRKNDGVNGRSLATGITHLETGHMWLQRAMHESWERATKGDR